MDGGEVDSLTAQRRLSLLVDASAGLAGSLDLRAVARSVAGALVPTLADRVEIDLVEALFHPAFPTDAGTGMFCRVAQVERTAAPRPAEDEWVAHAPGSPAALALAGARAEVAATPGGGWLAAVPLRARGRVLGVAALHGDPGRAVVPAEDLGLVEEIASRAALALDNIRLYEEARATALALQRSLLPIAQPRVTGLATAHRYLPGLRDVGVGGDWFDVIPLSCGRVAMVIGDVMGRGLRAAAAMGKLRTAVRTLASLDVLPEDLLSHVDRVTQDDDQIQLATCVYAVFDPVERSLSYATAGHPPPILHAPGVPAALLPQPSGAPLGVGGVAFEHVTLAVEDGSRLLLYTDGLIESVDSDIDHGMAGLAAVLDRGAEDLDLLCDELLSATGRDAGHPDDIALLVARLTGLDRDRVATWALGEGWDRVSGARRWVRERFETWGLGEQADLAELLVSELATNSLRHGTGPVELRVLLLDEVVTIAARDGAAPLPRLRRAADTDEGGRGLHLVSQLAARWGTRPAGDGKVVWCELPRPRP